MTTQEMVILNLTPLVELNEEEISFLLKNRATLREVQDSELYELSHLHLNLKKHAEGIEVPSRDVVKSVVTKASDFLAR